METRSPGRWSAGQAIGILLIVVGGLYLARNAGWIAVDWRTVWPILVIGAGLWIAAGALTRGRDARGQAFSVRESGDERLDLELRVGAGRFRMGGGAGDGQLVEVESTDDDIEGRVRRDGRRASVRLARSVSWWPFGPWHGGAEWRVALTAAVPLQLDVAGGAGDFDIDLQDVQVTAARLAVGAAQVRLALPYPTGDVPVHLSAGASSVTIEVPPGVEASVATSGLLSVDGRAATAGYATAADRVSVRVDGGAGSVRIRGTG